MTQLNLSGRRSNNTQQNRAAEPEGGSIKNQTVGALGALAMFAAVIVIGSCSRSSKPVAVQQPIQPTAPSAPVVAAPVSTLVPAPVMAKTKPRTRRAATLSYVNRDYGLSFNFPRNYQLKSAHEAQSNSAASERLISEGSTNFVHPGGVMLATLELPRNSYPGTDFKSAFVDVSVNPGMTAEACAQFAVLESSPAAEAPSQVKIGAIEFREVENSTAATTTQIEAKFFHAFSNGACYEFALRLRTEGSLEGVTAVDHKQVFGKLEKILATVKLPPTVASATEATAPSAATTAPADSANSTADGATNPN